MPVFVLVVVAILSGETQIARAEIEPDLDTCIERRAEALANYSLPGTLYMSADCIELDAKPETFSGGGK